MSFPKPMQHALAGRPGGGAIVSLTKTSSGFHFACTRCSWNRTFGTKQGAIQAITEHNLNEHMIQSLWRGKI